MAPSISPYTPELAAAANDLSLLFSPSNTMTPESLPTIRAGAAAVNSPSLVLTDPEITHTERTIPGPHGDIQFAVLQSAKSTSTSRAAVYYIHGGGMVLPGRFSGISLFFPWIKELDLVFVSVEYRVAPEHPHPVPVDDCYAGLMWMVGAAGELGVDRERIMLAGSSAGGGLAAATALMVRDRKELGTELIAQCLMYPMLDDRMITCSSQQFMNEGLWNGVSNVNAWDMLLEGKRGEEGVSEYAAPARAKSLEGLPKTWIEVGGAELFRDEVVEYARRLWEVGNDAELHVWRGAWHAFDVFAPATEVAKSCLQKRSEWARQVFEGK
ncbi:hypothetical protein CJF31_00001368 [Rutstroemia sp. NJR-2017a BVV2]|nr:hypothetical protein CJF31_00001368 [Rutstroemia sp. NJR-2017a BVV2]